MRIRIGVLLCALVLVWTAGSEAADLVGKASIGASGGTMKFVSGDDFGQGSARLIGQAVFKYNFTPTLAGVLDVGWGWNGYPKGSTDTLAVVVPATIGVEYRFHAGAGKLWPHAGAGTGLYQLGVQKDAGTYARAGDGAEILKWTSLGFYGKAGTEYVFDNGISINLDFLYHAILSDRTSRYAFTRELSEGDPSPPENNTWGLQNTSFAEIRIGVNYYFTLKESSPAPPKEE